MFCCTLTHRLNNADHNNTGNKQQQQQPVNKQHNNNGDRVVNKHHNKADRVVNKPHNKVVNNKQRNKARRHHKVSSSKQGRNKFRVEGAGPQVVANGNNVFLTNSSSNSSRSTTINLMRKLLLIEFIIHKHFPFFHAFFSGTIDAALHVLSADVMHS